MTKIQKNLTKLSNQGLLDVEEITTIDGDEIRIGNDYQDQITMEAIRVMKDNLRKRVVAIRSNAQIEAMTIFGGSFNG